MKFRIISHYKRGKKFKFTFLILFLFFYFISPKGSVELDLLNLIPPAKSPEKCSLKMLPGMPNSPSLKRPMPNSLFSQKAVRGWWPCVNEQDGKPVLGVSCSSQHTSLFFFFNSMVP